MAAIITGLKTLLNGSAMAPSGAIGDRRASDRDGRGRREPGMMPPEGSDRMILRLAILLWLLPALAQAATWRLDPATRIAVDVAWQGGTVELRFPRLSGSIEFDEQRPETARARIAVSAADVETGLAPVDALVRSRDYLDTARHPEITFELDRLEQTSRSTATIFGRITLRGVTRPVRFEATVFRYGPAPDDPDRFEAGFDLTGAIDRTEFGSNGGLPEVAAVVPVRIRLVMVSE
jgi:polyisoprenoid-binding protein YceI